MSPIRYDTKRAVQAQKMAIQAGNFGFRKYLGIVISRCSENKGACQLRVYCEADLRLCFRTCEMFVFS